MIFNHSFIITSNTQLLLVNYFMLDNPTSIEQLSNNLRGLMQERALSEAALSRATKIPQPTLHKILAGKTCDPRISTLNILAQYFSTTVDQLYQASVLLGTPTKPYSPEQTIPITTWDNCTEEAFLPTLQATLPKLAINQKYLTHASTQEAQYQFVLMSKQSMVPFFNLDTYLVIDTQVSQKDGDFVIVHYHDTREATIRQLHIDGPDQWLTPIHASQTHRDICSDNIRIIGKLIEAKMLYKEPS